MNNDLIKVEQTHFHNVICDVYTNQHGEFFMTREQIGRALEYGNPTDAVAKIHRRDKERLDRFSGVVSLSTPGGGTQATTVYNARGVYEICRHSHQPKADEFYDYVYDLLEGLRHGYIRVEANQQSSVWQQLRLEGKAIRRTLTDAIRDSGEDERMHGHAYSTYTDLAYKFAANKTARQLRKERGATPEAIATDFLTADELSRYNTMESRITVLLDMGLRYDQIKGLMLHRLTAKVAS